MKRWIHAKEEPKKVQASLEASAKERQCKEAFANFKKKYPKAYEVLGK